MGRKDAFSLTVKDVRLVIRREGAKQNNTIIIVWMYSKAWMKLTAADARQSYWGFSASKYFATWFKLNETLEGDSVSIVKPCIPTHTPEEY